MRLTLPVLHVAESKQLHEGVTRILATNGTELDMPAMFSGDMGPGTRFMLEIGDKHSEFETPDCVMQGVVYAKNNSVAFASFGGLLAKLEGAPLEVNQNIRLALTRTRCRKRVVPITTHAHETRSTRARET